MTHLIIHFPPLTINRVDLEAFASEQLLSRHVLGFAVGHHANDAYHQQRHADASYSQHSSLVELLGLCG